MNRKKVINLVEYRNEYKSRKHKDKKYNSTRNSMISIEEIDRIKTLNLFMKVIVSMHKESYK